MASGGITHRTVAVNGINMHVAEKGTGPVVLFLHGFPELWYSWRHQILSLSDRGYRAVAPDLRGYGDTDAPPSAASYTILHIVGDLVALIDELGQDKVFVVGHDWGAMVAWNLCLLRPDRVRALVNLSVAYQPRNPALKPVTALRMLYGDDYYICRFQEPGEAEAEFSRLGTALVLKKFLTYRTPGPIFIPKEGWDSPDTQIELPPWLSEDDINYYASKFEKSGFTGALNYYRALDSQTPSNLTIQGSTGNEHERGPRTVTRGSTPKTRFSTVPSRAKGKAKVGESSLPHYIPQLHQLFNLSCFNSMWSALKKASKCVVSLTRLCIQRHLALMWLTQTLCNLLLLLAFRRYCNLLYLNRIFHATNVILVH